MRFRKILTKFGQLPLIILPLLCTWLSWWGFAAFAPQALGDALAIAWLAGRTLFLSYAWWSLIKFLHYKPRPIPKPYTTRREKIDASSFPSIHSANGFILAFRWILAVTAGTWWWVSQVDIPSYSPAAIIFIVLRLLFFIFLAASRVVLKKHYVIDTLVGTLFGIMCVVCIMMFATEPLISIFELLRGLLW